MAPIIVCLSAYLLSDLEILGLLRVPVFVKGGPVDDEVWTLGVPHQHGLLDAVQALRLSGTLPAEVQAPADVFGLVLQTARHQQVRDCVTLQKLIRLPDDALYSLMPLHASNVD